MITALIFIIVLAALIFVHELGHFLFAKACRIRVDAFAIGFGPKIVAKKWGETTYAINAIPFGGYVKIFGENPDEESISGPHNKRSLVNKSRLEQIAVLFGGVLFNFLFAWFLFVILFSSGITVAVDGFSQYSDHFSDRRIMIVDVTKGSPAEQAGIKVGDIIGNIDSNAVDPTANGENIISAFQNRINESAGNSVDVNIIRDGKEMNLPVVAKRGLVSDRYAIGVAMQDAADIHLPLSSAVYEGGYYTLHMMKQIVLDLYDFFAKIFRGAPDLSGISGPVGIAGIVGTAAEMGFLNLLMITAIISVDLGIINLVPFPALDGGRILFVVIEAIIRKPIPHRFTNIVNAVGFSILIALMVLVTFHDIWKLLF